MYRLESLKELSYIALDACCNVAAFRLLELLADDVLVKLDITLCDTVYDLLSHLRYLLAILTLEAVCHQPLANELL